MALNCSEQHLRKNLWVNLEDSEIEVTVINIRLTSLIYYVYSRLFAAYSITKIFYYLC